MKTVSKELINVWVPITHSEYLNANKIANLLDEKENYELKVIQIDSGWKITIKEMEKELIAVHAKTKKNAYQLLITWLQYFYPMMKNQPVATELYECKKDYYIRIMRNNESLKNIRSDKDHFWEDLKQESIKNILFRPPINLVLESGDLTPLNSLALEYFLLENYVLTTRKENSNKIRSSLYPLGYKSETDMELNVNLISENRYPNLRSHLLKSNIRMFIKKEEALMLRATLMNIDTGETLEDVQNTSLPSLLEEIEFNLKNRKIRIRKSE